MEERRLLLALALSILVMTVWGYWFAPSPRSKSAGTPGAPVAAREAPAAEPSVEPGAPAAAPAAAGAPRDTAAPRPAAATPVIADERERRVEAETPEASLAFSNRGARLLSWQLKKRRDARGRGEEMVPAGKRAPSPLDLETGEAEVDDRLREALFKPSAETFDFAASPEAELVFAWSDGEIEAEKALRFEAGGEIAVVRAQVRRGGRPLPVKVVWGPGLGNPTKDEQGVQGYVAPRGVLLPPGGAAQRLEPDKLSPTLRASAPRFVGVESHYFAALFVPAAGAAAELRRVEVPATEEGAARTAALAAVDVTEAPARLFVGAKDYHALKGLGHGLAEVVDIGAWTGPLVVPLLSLLRFVHTSVGNYGWSIVALTVVINLLMAPLRHYSIANGIKMAKVSPEIRVIQERYRKVPLMERGPMNDEIARVYAKHGMNMGTQMAVGCLPILLTMPFLIAFYNVLLLAVDLKGAPFLWIPDLSVKDPLFVTPLLMGASMLVMQKLTPMSTMDPAQAKIMMLMPAVFTVMFVAAPAGLNLYWLSSNVCSIVQQAATMRLLRGREGAPGAAPRKKK
jgi:YidC/Oxa1 family membrane protein insertase